MTHVCVLEASIKHKLTLKILSCEFLARSFNGFGQRESSICDKFLLLMFLNDVPLSELALLCFYQLLQVATCLPFVLHKEN